MRLKKGLSGVWIALLTIFLDRVSKAFMLRAEAGEVLPLLPGVVQLRRTANTGVAFSLFAGSGLAPAILAAAVAAGLAAWLILRPEGQSRTARAGLWMILGGGLGNAFDRVAYGAVIDFIELIFVRFAIFNLADAAICVGVVITAVATFADEWKEERAHGRASD